MSGRSSAGHPARTEAQTRGGVMVKKRKASVSKETFDEFLAEQGVLGTCEEGAINEIIAEQLAEAMKVQGVTSND